MARAVRYWPIWMLLLPAAFGAAAWGISRSVQKPDVRLASVEQLRAVLPKELLVPFSVDQASQARYKALVKLAKTLNQKDVVRVTENWSNLAAVYEGRAQSGKVSKAEQQALVGRLWKAHPQFLSDLSVIVLSGALALPDLDKQGTNEYVAICDLFRLLAFSADSYAAFGDFKPATKMIELSYRLADRMFASPGGIASYLTAILMAGITTASTAVFYMPGFPAEDGAALLRSVSPGPMQDEVTASAIQADFVTHTLADLAENKPKLTGAGTYDAFETATAEAKAAQIAISNVRKPFAKADYAYFKMLLKDANDVLRQVDPSGYRGPYKGMEFHSACNAVLHQVNPANPPTPYSVLIRFNLNRIHNSLGRLDRPELSYDLLPLISCNWCAIRDLTRILLASRVYRASHRGKLPDSTSDFIPLLGAWPTNPFDGKPFTYLPKTEKIYGVREDLIDHGGEIGNGFPDGKDAGISLKLTK